MSRTEVVESGGDQAVSASVQPSVAPSAGEMGLAAAGIFVAAFVVCLAFQLRLKIFAADDASIHLRIAQHLLTTGHALFNSGERVMVTSSPVWTILLALASGFFKRVSPAIPLAAFGLSCACVMAYLLARTSVGRLELGSAARRAFVALPPLLTFVLLLESAILQMETPLAVALVLAGFYFFEQQRSFWLALFVLAAFTRYEYFAVLVVVGAAAQLTHRLSARAALIGGVVLAVAAGWLMWQYGTIVPNTVKAKAAGYIISYSETAAELGVGRRAAVVALVVLVGLASSPRTRRLTTANLLFASGLVLLAGYIGRKTFIFPWYPPIALIGLLLGLAMGALATGRCWSRAAALVLFGMMVWHPALVAGYQVLAFATNQPDRDTPELFNVRTVTYRQIGLSVASVCPNATLMSSEIGVLGMTFPGEILDGFGLASPAAIKYHPMRVPEERSDGLWGAIPPGFVRETHPDVIVSYPMFAEALLRTYDHAAYRDFMYPPLPAAELALYHNLDRYPLHVWVANNGKCNPDDLDARIRSAFATH